MARRKGAVYLTEQTVHSLEQLLETQEAKHAVLTPCERGARYVAGLVKRCRGDKTTTRWRVRFDRATVDSLEQLADSMKDREQDAQLALGLQYLRQQVNHYRSPERAAMRQREVERVRRHKSQNKEADGA